MVKQVKGLSVLFLALLILLPKVVFGAMPVGIPDPNGQVPAAIMPELPTASDTIDAFPYDPIGLPTPTWNDSANQYYVDSSNSACNDSANSGRGSPQGPRCSLPGVSGASWTLSAGDQVFVVGDGATYGGSNDLTSVDMVGTSQNPIWIIGQGTEFPQLRFERFFWEQGQHVFFESVHFYSSTDDFRMTWSDATGPVEYFTFRHVQCSGSDGTDSGQSRRCFSLGGNSRFPQRFMVFYDVEVWGLGRWQDDRSTDKDMHGMQLNRWVRYVWLLDSKIYHVQGDSIQCANSQWFDYNYASRPHYFYVGNTEFYENYENAYDQKGCYHVVFSGNHVHDFYNSQKGANETAIITEQDGESDVGGRFSWFINNLVENTGTAFAAKATTDDAYIYVLGNVIRNITSQAILFTQRCYNGGSGGTTCPLGFAFAQNTVDCGLNAVAIGNPQNPVGSNQSVEIDGNIFYNCADGREDSPHNWESFSEQPLYLQHRQNAHYRTSGGNILLNQRRYDVLENNVFDDDIQFSNASSGDYSLLESSPAIGLVAQQNIAFATFLSMYGIDIKQDYFGNTWEAGVPIDAGAYQGTATPLPPPGEPPSGGDQCPIGGNVPPDLFGP